MRKEKPFYLSSGFIISTLGLLLTLVMSVRDSLPPEVAAYIMAGIGGFYIVARAVGKTGERHDSKSKKFFMTSEFWMASLGAVISVIGWLGDVIPVDVSAKILGTLTGLYTLGRQITKIGDPVNTVTTRKLDDVVKAIQENAKKVGMVLILCFVSMGMTACSLFGMDAPEPIPFATYVCYDW